MNLRHIRSFYNKSLKRIKTLKREYGYEKYAGIVKPGKGSSSKQADMYIESIGDFFNIDIYPGTLNLDLDKDLFLKKAISFNSKKGKYCVWPVKVNGYKCYAVKPPRARNWPNTLEIMSDAKLREKFKVSDGDELTVSVPRAYIKRRALFLEYRVKPRRLDL